MDRKSKRGERRRRTARAAARQQKIYFQILNVDRDLGYFRKQNALSCNCRKRCFGSPKVARGVCCDRGYRDAVKERIRGRRMAFAEIE